LGELGRFPLGLSVVGAVMALSGMALRWVRLDGGKRC
jgi:hypothetical protein